jgi:two-component system, chemotaxis family, sensor kinase Cph1
MERDLVPLHLHHLICIFKCLHSRDKFGGETGSGLTIVECHCGRIRVKSTPGVGSTFYFILGKAGGA